MKIYVLVLGLLVAGGTSCAQEKGAKSVKPPAQAEAAFKKAYPSASQTKWSFEDKNYEASFKNSGKEMSVVYSPAGELLETEVEINQSELPSAATDYAKKNYKGKIKAAAKITKSNGEATYEIEVGETELFFDKDGKFLKAEKEEDKEDKDDDE